MSTEAMYLPGGAAAPGPDEHLVVPESRQEVVAGESREAAPSRPGHADYHCRLDAVVGLNVAAGYVASTDLLTRRGHQSDFATDTCVRKVGRQAGTGQRYVEELAFEVVYQQSQAHARQRARTVIEHGVRRVFAIFVREKYAEADIDGATRAEVKEWSVSQDEWLPLPADSYIKDRCLRTPLLVRALLEAAAADDAAARALVAKRNPVLEKLKDTSFRDGKAKGLRDGKAKGFRDGKAKGLRDGTVTARQQDILRILSHRGIALDARQQARVNGCDDLTTLDRWFTRALAVHSADELFLGD